VEVLWTAEPALPLGGAATRGAAVGVFELSRADASSTRSTKGSGEIAPEAVRAAGRGDHQAFAAIVEHYDDRLRALAFHLLHDDDVTRDVLQDAYVKAYLGLREFRGESGLGTWLYRIVYTTCLNHLRSASRRPRPAAGADRDRQPLAGTGGDPAEEIPAAVDLAALLRSLPPEQRAAVTLVDAQGLGYARAAEILGVPQGTVASRVSSARAKLRRALTRGDAASAATDPREAP
jgi:RNA polymerase sigma-70 factor (ECF subfamily)